MPSFTMYLSYEIICNVDIKVSLKNIIVWFKHLSNHMLNYITIIIIFTMDTLNIDLFILKKPILS